MQSSGTGSSSGQLKRHLILAILSTVIVPLIHLTRSEIEPMHSWNRAFADLSFILLLIILLIGGLAQLNKRFALWVDWRKELGIWCVLLSLFHTIIFLHGWIEWDLWLIFYNYSPLHDVWVFNHGFGLANALGIIALIYGIKLVAISNDLWLRLLGVSAWKYLQQFSLIFYVLVSIHTAYFLYFHFYTIQRPNPPTFWFNSFFIISVSILFIFRIYVFCFRVKQNRKLKERRNALDYKIFP